MDSGRKQRGDEKVEITLDFAELKQRAADAASSTKKALVSSAGNVRQVARFNLGFDFFLIFNFYETLFCFSYMCFGSGFQGK